MRTDGGLQFPRLLGRVMALAVVAVGFVVVPASGAAACSCVMQTTGDAVARADTVLLGTFTKREDPDRGGPVVSSGRTVHYTLTVERVLKGTAGATTRVGSAADSATCGLEGILLGRRHVVFAQGSGGDLSANLCGGTTLATDEVLGEVHAITGDGIVPPAIATSPAGPAPAGTSGVAPPTAAGSGDGPVVTASGWSFLTARPVASALVAAGLALLAVVVVFRPRRARTAPAGRLTR